MNEHEYKMHLDIDIYYPDHPPRKDSHQFRKTKEYWKSTGIKCVVDNEDCRGGTEIHHEYIEWADAEGVDWDRVKKIHPDFDWSSFKEAADFIDSTYQTRPYCMCHHRAPAPYGKHFTPEPIWNMQKYKRKDFIYARPKSNTDSKPSEA